nr:hypothetical protein [Tanacetum cinerariifolium]
MIIESVGPKYKMPTNIKLYDGTTDLEDHLGRFASAANFDEWPMPVWCMMFQQTLDGPARGWFECLPDNSIDEWAALRDAFTTRYSLRKTVETGFIMGVPEIMKISSFMDSLNWLELAKRFSDKAPTTVNEMVKRLDDFVRFERAFAQTKLPKGETGEQHRKSSFPLVRKDDCPFRNNNHVIDQQRYDPETTIEEGIMLSHTGEGIMLSHTGDGTISLPVLHKEETTRPSLARLKETQTNLVGFVRETTKSLGKIELEVRFGSKGLCKRTIMKFTVIRPPSPYNVILGRKGLRAFRMQAFKKKQMVKKKEEEVERKALNVTKEILVNPAYPDQLVIIGVPRRIIEHNLNVNASIKPERQKRRVLAHEKSEGVATNVGEWVKAGERIPKKGQNRIKTGQKREAWRSQEKSKAVTIVRHVRFKVYELRISLD